MVQNIGELPKLEKLQKEFSEKISNFLEILQLFWRISNFLEYFDLRTNKALLTRYANKIQNKIVFHIVI